MSKAIVDGIIRSSLNRNVKRFDLIARRYSAANAPHVHKILYEDIEKTIVNNFAISMSKSEASEENLLENPRVMSFLKKVAKYTYNRYLTKYKKSKDDIVKKYPTYIYIYQPRLREKQLKTPIFELALPKIRTGFKKLLKGKKTKFNDSFTRATQFLHLGKETVGTETLRILGNTVSGEAVRESDQKGPKSLRGSGASDNVIEKNIDRSLKKANLLMDVSTAEAREAGTNVIINMLRNLEVTWKSKEKQLAADYRKDIVVYGTIGSSADNIPGSESYDWKNLREEVEREIAEILFENAEDFASKAASMPPAEKVARLTTNQIIDAVVGAQNKNFRVKATREKVQKRKSDKSKVGQPNTKKRTKSSGSTLAIADSAMSNKGAATKKNSAPRSNLLRLQAILNAKLPAEVRKNMGVPALENRSGAFASSVRITDISTTAKGFPSVGYTYDKSTYQIFEMGKGKTPWASAQRDPRKLIDRSIREIASEQLVGRFFTRRM